MAGRAAAVGLVYPFLMAHTGPGIPCPLRTLTGVPCPCCGLTTATVSLVHGGWLAAARPNPAAYLVAAFVIGTAPVLVARLDSLVCYLGFLFPLWDAKRQTFADKIIHTVVVPV